MMSSSHPQLRAKRGWTTRPTACIVMFTMNKTVSVAVGNTDVARHSEEPGAGIPHAGICGGGAGQLAFLPQSLAPGF